MKGIAITIIVWRMQVRNVGSKRKWTNLRFSRNETDDSNAKKPKSIKKFKNSYYINNKPFKFPAQTARVETFAHAQLFVCSSVNCAHAQLFVIVAQPRRNLLSFDLF